MNKPTLFPKTMSALKIMGENIKLARLRRKFTPQQVSERATVSLNNLSLIEQGDPDISLREYISVLRVLNLDRDIYRIAQDDPLGRKLQDLKLLESE